jgi:hypothetical protein
MVLIIYYGGSERPQVYHFFTLERAEKRFSQLGGILPSESWMLVA